MGRILPGEASSIVTVCQLIDTEGVDKYLQRGARLLMDILDDRALREPRDVITAIRYGLVLLDNKLTQPFNLSNIPNSEKYENLYEQIEHQLNNFPDKYNPFLSDIIEEKLESTIPEKLGLYINTYQFLFDNNQLIKDGFDNNNLLQNAIKKVSELNSPKIKLWGLSKALENNIDEFWVMEQLEETLNILPIDDISSEFHEFFLKFFKYSEFSISSKLRNLIVNISLSYIGRFEFGLYPRKQFITTKELIFKLNMIEAYGKNKKNSLMFWSISLLLKLSILNSGKKRRLYGYRGLRSWNYPLIANPEVKQIISENKPIIEDVCTTFSKDDGPSINLITTLFEFLLEPCNIEKYNNLYEERQRHA
ncbi:MAG: hypothetical protein K8E24_014920, partial [Methanobacterium paludis]|nr:hypothetical protein [Methanobacterium paludis]